MHKFHLAGIGNAIVDRLFPITDSCFEMLCSSVMRELNVDLKKGAMLILDEHGFQFMERYIASTEHGCHECAGEIAGGSTANTLAGFSSFGGNGCFFGKIGRDSAGEIFEKSMLQQDVSCLLSIDRKHATAVCFVFVTPDAQRTMLTYLGASSNLEEEDIDPNIIGQSHILYMEGYLWDCVNTRAAFLEMAHQVHKSGNLVALSLSDVFCVERHRDDFTRIIQDGTVDVIFANEREVLSLICKDSCGAPKNPFSSFDEIKDWILSTIRERQLMIVTRSERGSMVFSFGSFFYVDAASVSRVVDTTGAGDLYAAGFLYALTQRMPIERCGYLASLAAAEVISHVGARPHSSLKLLLEE